MAVDADARPPARWLALMAIPVAVAVVLAGVWVTGALLTDDFRASMALTAVWFAAVVGGSAIAWRRVPALRPAAVATVATIVVVGGYLGYTSTFDDVVDEEIATGAALYEGAFTGLAHPTAGTARIVEDANTRVITFTDFETDPGPDLYVYVVPGRTDGDSVDGGDQLGRLKGNVGNQQYALPAGLDLSEGATVVIWCRAFSVSFGAAALAAS